MGLRADLDAVTKKNVTDPDKCRGRHFHKLQESSKSSFRYEFIEVKKSQDWNAILYQ